MSPYTATITTHSNMAWALYLSSAPTASVTDAQLAELDDYELAARASPRVRAEHLSRRIGPIIHALVCAAGAINSRTQMLRSVTLLHSLLTSASPHLLHTAVVGTVDAFLADRRTHSDNLPETDPPFLRPLVSIAVNRVSDTELSTAAANALSILLGHPALEPRGASPPLPVSVRLQADIHTRRLVAMLLTEVVLTSSPRALAALSRLLRRDAARLAFCEKDGVSTLASTLYTQPNKGDTAIGEQVAAAPDPNAGPVYASYHAVFSVWMLTFATSSNVAQTVLEKVVTSRLVVILAKLLNHSSGQRLKIARVTLASLKNMALGATSLHRRVRRDLLGSEVPTVLERLMRMTSIQGSLMGTDDDAVMDAQLLLDALHKERETMSTVDAYVAEVRAGALRPTPVHNDASFWAGHADELVSQYRDVIGLLAEIAMDEERPDQRIIACSDLAHLSAQSGVARRAILLTPKLKTTLMTLMVEAPNAELKHSALLCIQQLLLRRSVQLSR